MHKVKLYALSTCVWCKKTKQFLDDNGVVYDCVFVDKLDREQRKEIGAEVRKWNPSESFPTVVVDDQTVVVGYKVEQLREVLDL